MTDSKRCFVNTNDITSKINSYLPKAQEKAYKYNLHYQCFPKKTQLKVAIVAIGLSE